MAGLFGERNFVGKMADWYGWVDALLFGAVDPLKVQEVKSFGHRYAVGITKRGYVDSVS